MKDTHITHTGTVGKLTAVLVVLSAYLFLSMPVCADSWIRKSLVIVNYKDSEEKSLILNNSDDNACYQHSGSEFSGFKFGAVDKLYLKRFIGAAWCSDGHWFAGNSFEGYYRVFRKGSSAPGWSTVDLNNQDCEHQGYHLYSYKSQNDINLLSGLSAGDYYFEVALSANEYWDGGSYNRMIPGNKAYDAASSGYITTFTVPGFSSTSTQTLDFKDVNRGAEPENSSPYTHYGDVPDKPTVVNCEESERPDGYTNKPDMFEVTQITNSYIKFKFKTSNGTVDNKYCAKVVITEPHGKGNKTVIVKGKVITPQPEVRISEEAIVKDGPHTTMFGYVKYTGCKTIDAVGFVYSTSDISGDPAATLSGTHIDLTPAEVAAYNGRSGGSTINQGDLFSKTKYGLTTNTTYHYRAYIHSTTAVNDKYYFFSEQKDFTAGQTCDFTSVGDTVYYTIDGSKEADWCSLRFPSLTAAVEDMQTSTRGHVAWMNPSTKLLSKPVVFEVVAGTYRSAVSGKRDSCLVSLNTTSIDDATSVPSPELPGEKLIVRAKNPNKKPIFKDGLNLLEARNITLKDLVIERTSSKSHHWGSAVEFGHYSTVTDKMDYYANNCEPGAFSNANIELINCKVEASAFNCIHAVGCNGLKFFNCEFIMNKITTSDPANDRNWGASVKLMSCMNVEFTRNSLKGSHATTLFLQHTQRMLILNNVFWNDNEYDQNVAFVRPMSVSYYCDTEGIKASNTPYDISDLAVYYNTFFLKNRDGSLSSEKVDFLRFGGPASGQAAQGDHYIVGSIYFRWNNCYSYDNNINERNDDATAFLNKTLVKNNVTPNNFWGIADDPNDNPSVKSNFSFPSSASVNTTGETGTYTHINVKKIVCQSTADNPDDLVISENHLNLGTLPPESGIEVLNEAHLTLADRFEEITRPEDGTGWTYGAFQQTLAPDPVSTIIWAGSENDKWDIRGNWRTEDGKRLSCVYGFTDNLTAIIPNGTVNSPLIPAWGVHTVNPSTNEATDPTTAAKRGKYPKEYVEAGRKPSDAAAKPEIKKFVDVFDLKYGATVKGVENLGAYGNANTRYTQAVNTFMVPRSKWVFISSVIKPWDSDGPQNVRGLDLFLDGVPQVYLAELGIEDEKLTLTTYTDTWTSLPAEKGWAIRIPDQYGPKRQKAVRYYEQNPTAEPKIWGNDSIKYYFNGRFYNETAVPTYSGLKANDINIVSNTYPANINASVLNSKLAADSKGSVQFFDTNLMSFRAVAAGDTIRSQQTFLIETAADVTEVTVCDDATHTVFINGSSRHVYTDGVKDLKSAEYVNPFISIDAINLSSGTGSNIVVSYDELKDDSYNVLFDGRKLFNDTEITAPEVYMLEYDKKLCSYTTPTLEREIPLGLRLFQKMNVRFYIRDIEGLTQAEIIDREMETSFDIVNDGPYYTVELEAGTYEGRFYLNLGATASSIEDPIITEVEAMSSDENGISIFSKNNHVIVSAAGNIELHTLEIINMAGVVKRIPLANAHYNSLDIDSAPGVYIVKAIGSTMSRTEKIIIK